MKRQDIITGKWSLYTKNNNTCPLSMKMLKYK